MMGLLCGRASAAGAASAVCGSLTSRRRRPRHARGEDGTIFQFHGGGYINQLRYSIRMTRSLAFTSSRGGMAIMLGMVTMIHHAATQCDMPRARASTQRDSRDSIAISGRVQAFRFRLHEHQSRVRAQQVVDDIRRLKKRRTSLPRWVDEARGGRAASERSELGAARRSLRRDASMT